MEDLAQTVKDIEAIILNISEQIEVLETEVITNIRKDKTADLEMEKRCKDPNSKVKYEVMGKEVDVSTS